MTTSRPRPAVLCILDGWGWRDDPAWNAIAQADTPTWTRWFESGPRAFVGTGGKAVGLPEGQMGNSEVGHMNIGAGRVAVPEFGRIDAMLDDGSMAENAVLQGLITRLKASGGVCHLLGLMSPGGVHSHQDQIAGFARLVASAGVPVRVHAFLDGRDTPPRSATGYLAAFEAAVDGHDVVIATVTGRFWAMDRDKRWDRVELAWDALVSARGRRADSATEAVTAGYAAGENDEFVAPTVIGSYRGMADGDGVLMANFRADRAREILAALLDPAFDGFVRSRTIAFAATAGAVKYSADLEPLCPPMVLPLPYPQTLGEYVAGLGLTQLRIAETEKYAHVTFFFNGGREAPFAGEERILVASPRVKTYDLKPEMSAPEVTDRLVEAINAGTFDLIVVNYANGDMVGHTGMLDAAIKAAEAVDACLARLADAVKAAGGVMLVTADHGNAELMRDLDTGQPHTQHTTTPVPLLLVNGRAGERLKDGRLADLAPTLLDLMGLAQPSEMTGVSLLVRGSGDGR